MNTAGKQKGISVYEQPSAEYYILDSQIWFGLGLETDRWNESSRNFLKFVRKKHVLFFCEDRNSIWNDPFLTQAYDIFKWKLVLTKHLLTALWQIRPTLVDEIISHSDSYLSCVEYLVGKRSRLTAQNARAIVDDYVRARERGEPRPALTKLQSTLSKLATQLKNLPIQTMSYSRFERHIDVAIGLVLTQFAYNIEYALDLLDQKKYCRSNTMLCLDARSRIPESNDVKEIVEEYQSHLEYAI